MVFIFIMEKIKIEVFIKENDVRGGQKPKRTPTPSPTSPIHGPCTASAPLFADTSN